MLEEPPFLIYKSSAGSGKTYTLAKEYLKLALRSPYYFRRILAVTFTNKAADEMKERVLSFLESLAADEDSALMDELTEILGEHRAALVGKAEEILRNILHDYSAFAIATIDTFFNQVIRAFTREIGLQGGFEIEMDLDNVLKEVIDKMLADIRVENELMHWLVAFARERLKEGKSYEFREDVKTLAMELFKEQYKALEDDIDGLEVDKGVLSKLNLTLGEEVSQFQDELKAIGLQGLQLIEAAVLAVEDFSRGKSGPAGQFVKWSQDDFKEPGKTVLAALEAEEKWYTKKSPLKERLADVANLHLMPLLSKGVDFYQNNLASYYTANEVRKYLYTFGILNDLVTKIREYREEKEVILISDLPQFLRKIIDDSDTPYIYEKFGNRFHHFLIDEFQDTSHFQWNNFKPLVTNSLASGNFNMIVGDVKQSIYRWRGGNADLLLTEAADDVGEQMTRERVLAQNFRSHAEVIDFNNEVFQVAPLMLQAFLKEEIAHLSEEYQQRAAERIERLVQSFESSVQEKTPRTKIGGQVQVCFSAKPKAGEELRWDDLAVAWAIEQLEQCQQQGVPLREIAILVRDSGQESKLVKAIGLHEQSENAIEGCSYQVISAQAMYLTNASVVNFMLAVFKYLNNQKEQIALMEVVNEYQRHILDSDIDPHLLYTRDSSTFLPPEFTTYLHTLGRFPLYELTEILIRIFKLDRKQGELAYLQAFQDAILDYTRKEKGDLPSFLTWWELKGRKRTVRFSDSLDAAKILTIHKSKGLQYHTVIMPFCNWKMDHNVLFSNILWKEKPKREPYGDLPAIPLRYSSGLRESLFADEYFEEKIKAHHDNLNLLYVAFTRAEQTLLVHGEVPGKSRQAGKITSVSDILWDHLKDSQYFDEEANRWQVGVAVQQMEPSDEELANEVLLDHYPSYKWRNRLTIRKQSGNYFDFGESVQELKVNLGVLTHQILAEVRYSEELVPAVKAAYMRMEITKEDADRLMRGFEQLLEDEQIAHWYSRDYEVRNEVVVLPGDGSIKRLDRVMIKDGQAIVIDFKTGKPISGDKQQVLNYVSLLEEMAYEDVSGYLVYLSVGPAENQQIKPQVIQVV